jgi:hypothetical protein
MVIFGGALKVGDSFHPLAVLVAELGVEAEDLLLIAGEGTAQAVILALVPVVEHVHVNLSHQAPWAAVIQLAFSTLSHVRSSPFPLHPGQRPERKDE